MPRPLVSIIVPAYNAAPFIADAVRSVLDQTHGELELIIVDDGSTDDTAELVGTFVDPRVLLVRQTNAGVSAARNSGLDRARGEFIGFLDADDAMEPSNIERKLAHLERTGRAWVFGDLVMCDAALRPTGQNLVGTDGDVVRTILLGTDTAVPAPCSNALFHRRCFAAGFRFPIDLSNAADQYLALMMARDHDHVHFAEALNRYRVVPGSMSKNVTLYAADHLRLMEKARAAGFFRENAFERQCMANAHWSIGGSWWRNGRSPLRALPHLLRAVLIRPAVLGQWSRRRSRAQRGGPTAHQ